VPEAKAPVARKAGAPAGASTGTADALADPREERLTEVGFAFRHAYRSLRRLRGRDTHRGGGDIGHAQFELLVELRDHGALSASELSAATELSPATISQMLDHLADCGHVERVRSETDRRVVVTKLTRKGSRRLAARKEIWRDRWREALADVDDEELRIAADVLERIGDVFSDPPAAPAKSSGPAD
jgi:DNA-binding MarR family transcriptional regulator